MSDGLDPKFWGPAPTRWQVFTARLWQRWLKLSRALWPKGGGDK